MTASAAENTCRLTARFFSLSTPDRMLVERFLDTLEARANAPVATPMDRIRKRIEAARSQNGETR